ncbi:MAG: alkaline phosphatase family protein [Planctomycetes bacterium]|nr:alkaline phosphatase family protein [Planctomycetota bacterium]
MSELNFRYQHEDANGGVDIHSQRWTYEKDVRAAVARFTQQMTDGDVNPPEMKVSGESLAEKRRFLLAQAIYWASKVTNENVFGKVRDEEHRRHLEALTTIIDRFYTNKAQGFEVRRGLKKVAANVNEQLESLCAARALSDISSDEDFRKMSKLIKEDAKIAFFDNIIQLMYIKSGWVEDGETSKTRRMLVQIAIEVSEQKATMNKVHTVVGWVIGLSIVLLLLGKSNPAAMRTAMSSDVAAKTLWELLGDAGKRSCILNVPITYPAGNVNGMMLTGFVSPDETPFTTWPRTLYEELSNEFTEIALNWSVLGYRPRDPNKRESHIQRINELMELRNREFDFILGKDNFDFCFLVHEYTDRVQHLFYHILDPTFEANKIRDNQKSLELLHKGHRALDDWLGRVVDRYGQDANYMFVSDHGFDGVHQWVYINNLLESIKLLATKSWKLWADVASRQFKIPLSIRRRLGLEQQKEWHKQDPCRGPLVDYTRSVAFAGPQLEHAVYVNLKGRFPDGIVEPGEQYEKVKRQIVKTLSEATDPQTGASVFQAVWTREEIYHGPYLQNAPDVIYELAPGYMVSNTILPPLLLKGRFLRGLKPGWDISGYHRPEGIFLASGPAFERAKQVDASVLDIAPTVLYLMGLPIPRYMDGKIIEQAIDPKLLQAQPPRYCDVDLSSERDCEVTFTTQEQAAMTKRLSDLGYL